MRIADDFVSRLPSHLFWDVDRETLHPDAHARFLICRVMERGKPEDVRLAWNYYGAARIRDELIQAPSLSRKTLNFFANQFQLPRDAFRAHQRGQNWAG
jgi:hypothetical protein